LALARCSRTRCAITLEAIHAKEVNEQAFARYGTPEIVNTDQGSQSGFIRSSQHLNHGGV
jgi:putative transposase